MAATIRCSVLTAMLITTCLGGSAFPQRKEPPLKIVSVTSHKTAFDRPHDVELLGDLAFVPGKGGSLAIVDVSEPKKPAILWHRHDADRLHDAETVLPATGRLFLGTNDFLSIDIGNPEKPVFDKRLGERSKISHINGMVRRGEMVLAAGKNGYLEAFDVSKPADPQFVASVNLRQEHNIGWPHDLDLWRTHAVVVDPRRFGRLPVPGKLALLRVFHTGRDGELLPAERWELTGLLATDELVGANRVQVAGDYAYVGASTTGKGGRLIVVDLSDPESPRQVAHRPFAKEDGYGPNGLTIAGRVLFLAGGQSVEAIDISRPQQPVKLAARRFADVLANGQDSGHDLVYRDGYLYVTGQNDHCLLILQVRSRRIRRLAETGN